MNVFLGIISVLEPEKDPEIKKYYEKQAKEFLNNKDLEEIVTNANVFLNQIS